MEEIEECEGGMERERELEKGSCDQWGWRGNGMGKAENQSAEQGWMAAPTGRRA